MNLNEIIQYHFKSCIKEKHELPECRKEGYILILDNGKKIVFRAQNNYHEIFLREKFFYDNVNKRYAKICPDVYVVDGTLKLSLWLKSDVRGSKLLGQLKNKSMVTDHALVFVFHSWVR